ncbi:hypothetical protein GE061_006207 [Apolygus lucorum]|uniref:Uncharacterized protein n=1 Tax=Apolygus lucorum TaxID=248454 RepID=A0A8S9WUM5_APOLU|nr:hypothetical protein GE061_006207 [Apolygus lucorum]
MRSPMIFLEDGKVMYSLIDVPQLVPPLWPVIRLYTDPLSTLQNLIVLSQAVRRQPRDCIRIYFLTDGGQVTAARLLTKYFHRHRKMEKLYRTAVIGKMEETRLFGPWVPEKIEVTDHDIDLEDGDYGY